MHSIFFELLWTYGENENNVHVAAPFRYSTSMLLFVYRSYRGIDASHIDVITSRNVTVVESGLNKDPSSLCIQPTVMAAVANIFWFRHFNAYLRAALCRSWLRPMIRKLKSRTIWRWSDKVTISSATHHPDTTGKAEGSSWQINYWLLFVTWLSINENHMKIYWVVFKFNENTQPNRRVMLHCCFIIIDFGICTYREEIVTDQKYTWIFCSDFLICKLSMLDVYFCLL